MRHAQNLPENLKSYPKAKATDPAIELHQILLQHLQKQDPNCAEGPLEIIVAG